MKIRTGIALYEAFETVHIEHRLSFLEPRKANGRFGLTDGWIDMYVYADPDGGGLTGFSNMLDPPNKQAWRPSEGLSRPLCPVTGQQPFPP